MADEKDLETILYFIKSIAEFEKLTEEVTTDVEKLRASLFGKHSNAEAILAEDGTTAVGFVVFFHNFSTFTGKKGIHLEDIFVESEYRNQGVGKLLMQKLFEIALERNCERLDLTALNWNENALRFYESLGAKPQTEWTAFRFDKDTLQSLVASKK